MGLLSKAVVKASPELDETGKVLRDRIRRIPAARRSPDTALILPEIREVLIPPPEGEPPPGAEENDPAGGIQTALADEIRRYHKGCASFQGIVLESPRGDGETKTDFTEKVSRMVSSFSSVFPLSRGNCLMLFPETMDRELLAHRLSKSLTVRVLRHFQADDPGMAMIQLGPYL
jgi:hypothetical protein